MQKYLCVVSALRIPYQLSVSFDFDSGLSASPPLWDARVVSSKLHPLSPPRPDVSSLGRTTSKYTPRTPHPQQQATPHIHSSINIQDICTHYLLPRLDFISSPGRTSNILIARLIHSSKPHLHTRWITQIYSIYYAINELRQLWHG